MNHENLGNYRNNFYRKVFIPKNLKSYDVSERDAWLAHKPKNKTYSQIQAYEA